MRSIKLFLIVLIFSVLAGCVSTKEYKARLDDIDAMKKNNAALEEKLKATDAELTKQKEENAGLKKLLDSKKDELVKTAAELKAQVETLSKEKAKAVEEKDKAISELKSTYTNLVTELNEEIKKGEIAVTQLKDKLTLSMVDKILFDSGSADVKKDGKKVLDRVVDILKKVTDKQIKIEGHTDNVPIGSRIAKKFSTNWELSTARAINVVRHLQEKGIDPKLLVPAGYAEYKPVESNDTEDGRSKNRRIEIVLVPLEKDKGSSQN